MLLSEYQGLAAASPFGQDAVLRNWVDSSRMQRMTAQKSSHSEITAQKWTVFGNRVLAVLRACWIEATPRWKHGRNDPLIHVDNADKKPFEHTVSIVMRHPLDKEGESRYTAISSRVT